MEKYLVEYKRSMFLVTAATMVGIENFNNPIVRRSMLKMASSSLQTAMYAQGFINLEVN